MIGTLARAAGLAAQRNALTASTRWRGSVMCPSSPITGASASPCPGRRLRPRRLHRLQPLAELARLLLELVHLLPERGDLPGLRLGLAERAGDLPRGALRAPVPV